MRCLNCDYPLNGLSEHRCPECGRAFDPNDRSTFQLYKSWQPWQQYLFMLACLVIAILVMVLGAYSLL